MSQYIHLGTNYCEWFCKLFRKRRRPLRHFASSIGGIIELDEAVSLFVSEWCLHNASIIDKTTDGIQTLRYFGLTKKKCNSFLKDCKKEQEKLSNMSVYDHQYRGLAEIIDTLAILISDTNWLIYNCIIRISDFPFMLTKTP